MPDTAPLTGAPHEAEAPDGYRNDVIIHIGDVAINNGSMADAVEEGMAEGHGTNGTSYSAAGGVAVFGVISGVLYISEMKTQYEKYQDWCRENEEFEAW